MNSLFLRMFLWFCGVSLCGIIGVVVSYVVSNPEKIPFAWPQVGHGAIVSAGRTAVEAYERGGAPELTHYLESFGQDTGIKGILLNDAGRQLGGYWVDPELSGNRTSQPDDRLKMRVRERSAEVKLRGREGASYVFVAAIPRRERVRFWAWFFFASLLLTGSVLCYVLARHITAPIVHVRALTSRFASGDLSARITLPDVLSREDEIGGLARDYNQMAARIETLMKAQQRLIADVSHELRSPITRLSLAVGLMQRSLEPEARAPLARMHREVERLNALIAQLLMLSRLECMDQSPPMESIDLSALVQEIASDADFEAASLDRTVRLRDCAGCSMYGARDLIRSAIENVVRNALKYTDAKTQVSIRLVRPNGNRVATILVEDEGPGVPPDVLDHMFEPFYRVDEARDRGTGGTGLGLAITRQVVALHGGAVRAANRDGGGLAVSITLPVDSVV